jgi:hypothetical protein
MDQKVELMKEFAEIAFYRFDQATKDLSEKEIDWRPVESANSIRWILTHLSQQWNVEILRILRGDSDYEPEDWPADYVGNESYSLKKMMSDLQNGRNAVINGIEELNLADLETEIPIWGSTRKLQNVLALYLSEIFHHEGQIAYLRGIMKRKR